MNKILVAKRFSDRIKNLTVDKEYEVKLEDRGEFVFIENDEGIVTRYAVKIFEEKPEFPSFEEVMNNLGVTTTKDEETIFSTIHIPDFDVEEVLALFKEESPISCGIFTLTGINTLARAVKQSCEKGYLHEFTLEQKEDLASEILSRIFIQVWLEEENKKIFLLSTNKTDNTYWECISRAFSKIEEKIDTGIKVNHIDFHNENSGNDIQLITLYC